MSDAGYAEALARCAGPEACSGGTGHAGIRADGMILCAHADQDGQGMHWKLPGQACTATAEPNTGPQAGR